MTCVKAPRTGLRGHYGSRGCRFFCAVKDACSTRIVGYSIDARTTSDLAVAALCNALAVRGPVDTVVHSDRGSQFRSHARVRALREAQLRGSMGGVGACAHNAAMESFFSLVQKNAGEGRPLAPLRLRRRGRPVPLPAHRPAGPYRGGDGRGEFATAVGRPP